MSDRILGAVCIVASAGMAWAAQGYAAAISYEPVGPPRAFPLLLAALMAVGGAWLMLRPTMRGNNFTGVPLLPVLFCSVAVVIYALLFQVLGFTLATTLMALPVEMAHTWWVTLRSSVVGFVVGVLPGAGATIASAMTYSMEKRIAGASGTFGEGDIRGVAAPEAANNASAAGSFVPMLTLGVPGSGTTAVMVGALSLYNITPGPALFTQQAALVWGLIASLFIANVMLLFINIPLVGVFTKILQVPNWLLVPGILADSAVGVYAVHATTFDLVLMSVMGIVGYLLRKQGMPMAPLILGFVLGDMMEQNLRRALSITNGELGILIESPISIALWLLAATMLLVPPLLRRFGKSRSAAKANS